MNEWSAWCKGIRITLSQDERRITIDFDDQIGCTLDEPRPGPWYWQWRWMFRTIRLMWRLSNENESREMDMLDRVRRPIITPRAPTSDVREAVLSREEGICLLCGQDLGDEAHLDHAIPWSHGGPTIPDNLQPAHPKCNLSKGAS